VNHESLEAGIPRVLRDWGIGEASAVAPVPGGTLNWNFRVQAGEASFFLRCYRESLPSERITGEHELLAWASERGIPAPVPVSAMDGGTVVVHGLARWALFPWVEGVTRERGTLTAVQARAMGEVHGRIQAALAHHPESNGARLTMRWGKGESLVILEQVAVAAERSGAEPWVRDGIARQQHMLEVLDVKPAEYFDGLPCQLLHGDFHDQQLLFEGDRVAAVVDWEIWHTSARAWEVVRSLAFSELMESPLLAAYGAGYREHVQLSEEECRLALELWWQSRVVGCWVWAAHFLQGNARVAAFFPGTIAELDLVADEDRKGRVAERMVHAFCQ
jgi:homoserine kinase type II